MIFKLLAIEYEDINVDSLACRQWHGLVVNDPQLWSTIKIKLPENEWDMKSWSRSSRLYIRKCLERSHSSRLKVELDFSRAMMIGQRLIEMLASGFQQYTLSDTDRDLVLTWLSNRDITDLVYGLNIVSDWNPGDLLDLVVELIGPEGQFTMRWDSLNIRFPENDLASYGTCSLRTLQISPACGLGTCIMVSWSLLMRHLASLLLPGTF